MGYFSLQKQSKVIRRPPGKHLAVPGVRSDQILQVCCDAAEGQAARTGTVQNLNFTCRHLVLTTGEKAWTIRVSVQRTLPFIRLAGSRGQNVRIRIRA